MRRIALITILLLLASFSAMAQNVTVSADNRPAAEVFRTLMAQTGKNFVYSSDILKDVKVTVHARKKPLKEVLRNMFEGKDIDFIIRGKEVILKRKPTNRVRKTEPRQPGVSAYSLTKSSEIPKMLQEVVVVSRLEAPQTETAEIGAKKLTATEILNTPTLFGEADVIKALQMQPGIAEGTEGMAGMYVHGGNSDENLYMLDNVPLYQVNHFAGLFSAFNPEAIRYIDFYKSSVPAKYDSRLSSFLDVRTKNGSIDGHHGSARLGLTSGAFNIDGPIGHRTTYSVALRRSWYEVLSVPMLAIINSDDSQKTTLQYYFMDLNGKLTHRFNNRATGFFSVYFGDDMLRSGAKDKEESDYGWFEDDKYRLHWGNLVAQAGLNYRINSTLSSEFTAAYTRFFSNMKHEYSSTEKNTGGAETSRSTSKTDNNINDWIFKADFDWRPSNDSRIRFGANYVRHSFLPSRMMKTYQFNDTKFQSKDSTWSYHADEANIYIEDDWKINSHWRMNAGLHGSFFHIDGKMKWGISPRLSVSYRPTDSWAIKGAYSRTTQYVHQLTQSYLSLPTDQWIPVTGNFKPQTADKVSVGGYWQSNDGQYAASVEGYWKWMRHLVDYRDEYYLRPPMEMWNSRLTSGKGTAKGIDFKIEKLSGKFTGHIAYSLAWADRTFKEKNMGQTYPARIDNRHTFNILVNWNISDKISLNASWTAHSGNRFTLLPQVWGTPDVEDVYTDSEIPLKTRLNDYRLPFYHRLDLSCTVRNRHGYWNFGLFNAYCHMNTVAVRRTYTNDGRPVFQKVKLLPIIPSISYTWQF